MFKWLKIKENIARSSSIAGFNWLCMDIGTENMKARYVNNGLRFDEPSYIAEDYEKKRIYYGHEAKALVDKVNENIVIKRPVRDGNIADPQALEKILVRIFSKFKIETIEKDKLIVIMATPSEINPVQKTALEKVVEKLGAKRGFIQEEVKMAALGSGQDIFGTAVLCVDMGGGSTDIATIAKDSILYSATSHCAGDYLNDCIRDYIADTRKVRIGLKEAEDLKKAIGSLIPGVNERTYRVSGVLIPVDNASSGEVLSISKTLEISPEEIRTNVMQKEFREHIIPTIRNVLRMTGGKAYGSISDLKRPGKGITICGGGSYIRGVAQFVREELAKEYHVSQIDSKGNVISDDVYEGDIFDVKVSKDPLNDVINGCVKYRDEIYREILSEKNNDIIFDSDVKKNERRYQ